MAGWDAEVTADLRGLEQFIQRAKPALQQVVKVAAFNVERHAKEIVHVDTGATRASIHTSVQDDGLAASIGPTTSYARALEFGTHNRQAYPFMRPALEQERQAFQAAIIAALKQAGASG